MFNFLKNCQTVFQSGWTILHFYQQCRSILILHILANICYRFILLFIIIIIIITIVVGVNPLWFWFAFA